MTMFAQPLATSGEEPAPDELIALARLESTCNTIRLRISRLAPDQLYRGTTEELSIAEELALAVDRERAYLGAFRRALSNSGPELIEPQPGAPLLDRKFTEDLATFFDIRRETLNLLRTIDEDGWQREVALPGSGKASLRELAIRLAQRDARMLRSIVEQRRVFLRTTGIDDLRDRGMAGKLGGNIGQ